MAKVICKNRPHTKSIEIQGKPPLKNRDKGNLEPSLFTASIRRQILKIINKVQVYEGNHDIGEIKVGSKTFYVCAVCGRLMNKKVRAFGTTYCNKHYKQQKKYGKVLDKNPRTTYDRNEIRLDGEIAYMDLYDKDCKVAATVVFDSEDVKKVQYTKWKLSKSGYAMNTPKYKGCNLHMSRVILGTSQMVDHINHNRLDNRKSNLRVVTKSQNAMNANYKGVRETKNGKYHAYIKINQKLINLGLYVFKEEAYFARWYAETLLFKEYRYPKEKPGIFPDRERDIMEYVNRKVQRL